MKKVVLIMFKDDDRRDFPLTVPVTTIGRRHEATLRIPAADVSRLHCEIHSNDTGITVKDLGSSNGTFVNGKRVAESPLKAGDKLAVGPVVFVVQVDGIPSKITPHDVRLELEQAAAAAGVAASPTTATTKKQVDDKKEKDEDVFELTEEDFDIDLGDDDDEKDMP
ncbi:FHA domain-containing protein FhaA [Phycisphaerae bacterium RAS1]|nr:FHA domain-containing protein FhaA [Phycisphaerae bacterium RAS1]